MAGLAGLLIVVSLAASGVAGAAPTDDAERCGALPLLAVVDPAPLAIPPAPRATFVLPGDRDVTVRWRVVAREQGLRLRLYGGHGLGALELLAEDAAVLGAHDYALSDRAPLFGFVLYELRVADALGREESLGSIVGVAPQMTSRPAAVSVPTNVAADLVGWPALGLAPIGAVQVASDPGAPYFVHEVPTPPPRCDAAC